MKHHSHHSHHSHSKTKKERNKYIVLGCALAFSVCVGIVIAEYGDYWLDNDVYEVPFSRNVFIDGTEYKKRNIDSYVIIGSDSNLKINEAMGDTADFIGYLFIDHSQHKYNVLQVSRDTLTKVINNTFDSYATPTYSTKQIAYSHIGSTVTKKNQNTKNSLYWLFNSLLPMDEYFAFTMPAIKCFNSFVGGVTITITADIADGNLGLIEGQQLTLDDTNVQSFVQSRSDASNPTNEARMRRHKAYLKAFFAKAMEKTNLSYNSLVKSGYEYIDDNVDVSNFNLLLDNISSYSFGDVIQLEGTSSILDGKPTITLETSTINEFLTTYIYERA